MAREIIIPGKSLAFDKLGSNQDRLGTGKVLRPEIRLDGTTAAFEKAYAMLLQTYGRRLRVESFERLQPEIGSIIARAINITAGLSGKTTDIAGSFVNADFYGQPLILDLKSKLATNELVYPKLVVFSQEDLDWALANNVILDTAIYREYTKGKFSELLKQNRVFVVNSGEYFDTLALRKKYGIR